MKIFAFVFILVFECYFNVGAQIKSGKNNGYVQFPDSYRSRDTLVRHVIPDKHYTYWEFDAGQFDTTKNGRVLFSKGVKPTGVEFKDPRGHMLQACMPGFCYKYIAYVYDGKIGYINSDAGLKQFIGNVDNLYEAVLMAELSLGIFIDVDSDARGGSYKPDTNGSFNFILTHFILCPMSKEAVQVIVTKDGAVKEIKRKTYHKEKDCAVI
jgi:hypothetical protein